MRYRKFPLEPSLTIGLAAACMALSSTVPAQTYPAKPLRVIVPLAAGGPSDVLARVLAPPMSETMKQPVVVENRAGAATQIGHNLVAKAAPDGYTIGMTVLAGAANATLFPNAPFDYLKDLRGVAFLTKQPPILAVNPAKMPVRTVREYIEHARKNPGTTYGFFGYGGAVHLLIEEMNQTYGTGITLVPYKGASEATAALVTDQVHSAAASYPAYAPLKGSPKIRMLAIGGNARISLLPDVPTYAEAGYENFGKHLAWQGVLAPSGTPDAMVNYLNRVINAAAVLPDVAKRFDAMNFTFEAMTSAQFDAFMRAEVPRIGDIIRKGNIKPE
jgi:tripartite-type tricarboxylate transporter receptor subunit TctC